MNLERVLSDAELCGGLLVQQSRPLAQFGAKRRVVLSVPCFSTAIYAVAKTDLVLTVPRKLTKIVQPWMAYV